MKAGPCQHHHGDIVVFTEWPKDLVRVNFVHFLDKCDPKELQDHFRQNDLLDDEEYKTLGRQLRNATNREVNRHLLLEVLPRKGPGAFDTFASCLFVAAGGTCRYVLTDLPKFPDEETRSRFKKLMYNLAIHHGTSPVQEAG